MRSIHNVGPIFNIWTIHDPYAKHTNRYKKINMQPVANNFCVVLKTMHDSCSSLEAVSVYSDNRMEKKKTTSINNLHSSSSGRCRDSFLKVRQNCHRVSTVYEGSPSFPNEFKEPLRENPNFSSLMESNISFSHRPCDGRCWSFQFWSMSRLASRVTRATTVALTVWF